MSLSSAELESVDLSEEPLESLYKIAANEYLRLTNDQSSVDIRDSVGLSQKISENTGVSLSVAAVVVASANSVIKNDR